jgi:hypothetical protein
MRVIPIQNNGFPGQGLILFGDDTLHQEMAKDGDIVEEQEEMESNG